MPALVRGGARRERSQRARQCSPHEPHAAFPAPSPAPASPPRPQEAAAASVPCAKQAPPQLAALVCLHADCPPQRRSRSFTLTRRASPGVRRCGPHDPPRPSSAAAPLALPASMLSCPVHRRPPSCALRDSSSRWQAKLPSTPIRAALGLLCCAMQRSSHLKAGITTTGWTHTRKQQALSSGGRAAGALPERGREQRLVAGVVAQAPRNGCG